MKWLKLLRRLVKVGNIRDEKYVKILGCSLCYDSGVVRFTARNSHFIEGDFHRECPNGC